MVPLEEGCMVLQLLEASCLLYNSRQVEHRLLLQFKCIWVIHILLPQQLTIFIHCISNNNKTNRFKKYKTNNSQYIYPLEDRYQQMTRIKQNSHKESKVFPQE